MFEPEDTVKYSESFIRESFDNNGVDQLLASEWRGKIKEETTPNVYIVSTIGCEEELQALFDTEIERAN